MPVYVGSSPTTGTTTSEQALYRLLRLFVPLAKKSECAHAAAPPLQIEAAPLGFDLDSFDGNRRFCIATRTTSEQASYRLLRLFMPTAKKRHPSALLLPASKSPPCAGYQFFLGAALADAISFAATAKLKPLQRDFSFIFMRLLQVLLFCRIWRGI